MAAKIKKGDEVIVIAGKDKGTKGVVLENKGKKLRVEGVALCTHYVRANPQANEAGGLQRKEGLIDVSNVAIVNPKSGAADRVGFKFLEDGKKVRYFKSNDEVIDI